MGPRSLFSYFLLDSTFLSIFAVPNNAVFWRTSNLTFTPIRFIYSPKLTETAPGAPTTTGTTITFRMRQTFATPLSNNWYFSTFSCSLSFTLSLPEMAISIMTASLSVLSMSGLLASIFRSHWTVKSYKILNFSLSITLFGFCSYQLLAIIYYKVANGYTVPLKSRYDGVQNVEVNTICEMHRN